MRVTGAFLCRMEDTWCPTEPSSTSAGRSFLMGPTSRLTRHWTNVPFVVGRSNNSNSSRSDKSGSIQCSQVFRSSTTGRRLWMGMSGPASVVMTLAVRSSVPSSPFHYSRSPAKTTGSPSVDAERAFTIGVLRDSQDSGDRADVPAGPPIRQQSRFQSGIQQPGELTGFVVEGDATAQTPSLCTGACETVRSTTLSQRTRR